MTIFVPNVFAIFQFKRGESRERQKEREGEKRWERIGAKG
jgi:hypothetical protein